MQPYASELGNDDQAVVDMFTTNELAYYIMGPWANPGFIDAQAANPEFQYDYTLSLVQLLISLAGPMA